MAASVTGGQLWRRLPGGRRGWFQQRVDDCMRAAVATVVGCHYNETPDPPHGEPLAWWSVWIEWATARGLEARLHAAPPRGADRWSVGTAWPSGTLMIRTDRSGVQWVEWDEADRIAGAHAVACRDGRAVHNPAPNSPRPRRFRAAHTFDTQGGGELMLDALRRFRRNNVD
jgi:hypothetical protein